MASTLTNLILHVVFSTKDRAPMIRAELRDALHAYLVGIVRGEGGELFTIGGSADHVHLLLKHPAAISVAELLRLLKSNSSKWVNARSPGRGLFGWQRGYAAFSVSQSLVAKVFEYIKQQDTHHRKVSFQEEFLALLKKHGVDYDERYIWG